MINEHDALTETVEQINQGSPELAAELHDYIQSELPAEKARAEKEMKDTAEALKRQGSASVEGLGQAIGSIPPILYHRWEQLYRGCWKDRDFVNEFLADNPQCCAPGYKPPAKTLYFDMGRNSDISAGSLKYHSLKARVAMDEVYIRDRIEKMTGIRL